MRLSGCRSAAIYSRLQVGHCISFEFNDIITYISDGISRRSTKRYNDSSDADLVRSEITAM